jgi:hypothetical protein
MWIADFILILVTEILEIMLYRPDVYGEIIYPGMVF